jgi:hypothetical protein
MPNLLLSPLGSRGFILGEIFGLSAGLTRVEHVLFLFFALRANLGSLFFPLVTEKAGLIGVEAASIMGLLPVMAAPAVLSGLSFGVFRADKRGVSSPSWIAVSSLSSAGRSNEASGKVKSSIMGGASTVSLKLGDGWIRIKEAGVAGVAP